MPRIEPGTSEYQIAVSISTLRRLVDSDGAAILYVKFYSFSTERNKGKKEKHRYLASIFYTQ
jgi:hypothetical protein